MARKRLTQSITIRISEKTLMELQDVADREDRDLSDIVRLFLERALKWQREKYGDLGADYD